MGDRPFTLNQRKNSARCSQAILLYLPVEAVFPGDQVSERWYCADNMPSHWQKRQNHESELTMEETPGFKFSSVEWNYRPSEEIGSNPNVRSGLKQAAVLCQACQHSWTALSSGPGKFRDEIGTVLFECPKCKQKASVSATQLDGG